MTEDVLKSDRVLEELVGILREEKAISVDEETVPCIVFRLGGSSFAFMGKHVKEILPFSGVDWIPGATAVFPGVVNIRGDIAAVIDLAKLFGIEDSTPQYMMLLKYGDGRNCIPADMIEDVAEVPVSAIAASVSILAEQMREYAGGQLNFGEQVATLLDVDKIMAKLRTA